MTEPLVIGSAELHHGDAIKVMKALVAAGRPVKLACFDPPYLLTSGGRNGLMSGAFHPDRYDNGGHLVACDLDWTDFMPGVYQALEDRAHAYVMANNRNVQPMLNAATAAGFEFHNLLIWDKITATPNRWYMKNAEFTGFFYKGKAQAINDCSSMSCIRLAHTDDSDHPTEKPVSLMELYIRNSTQPGDIVLDPFMGSGSTGVAAIRAGRGFIGIELDERWFSVAARRIRHAVEHKQESLF